MFTEEFLKEQGWALEESLPLLKTYTKSNGLYLLAQGPYGHIEIIEYDFDGNAARHFKTINAFLTNQQYGTLMDLLAIR